MLQAPLLAYNHFVETIFVLNNLQARPPGLSQQHSSAETIEATPSQEDSGIADSSPNCREKRDSIYR